MDLELKEDPRAAGAIETQTISFVPTATDATSAATDFSVLDLENAMDLDQPGNNEPMQPVATSVLSVNISESESEFEPDDDP